MATTQSVTHFDLHPNFDVLIRPAHGGEIVVSPDGWRHYAWHVLIMCGDENMSFVYGTGIGLVQFDQDSGAPIIPEARSVLASIVTDEDTFDVAPTFTEFLAEQYGGEDPMRAYQTFEALRRQHEDLVRVFPLHRQHFMDTYRED